jgi:hypothetical protein
MLAEHGSAERLGLAERDGLPSDSAGGEGESSDSAEEVEVPQLHSPFVAVPRVALDLLQRQHNLPAQLLGCYLRGAVKSHVGHDLEIVL